MSQKGCHQTHNGNFVKSQPIFKILSPLERKGNLQKNFENRLRFDEVTAMSLVAPFLGHGV